MNVVGASCKRNDLLHEKQANKIREALCIGELMNGRRSNQETSLKRAGDTRWGSLVVIFCSVIEILHEIAEDGARLEHRGEVYSLLESLQSFDFAFNLNLTRDILGITNELSQTLQRKDQDIINAVKLVEVAKMRLQTMKDGGWNELFDDVSSFCNKLEVPIPNLNDIFVGHGRLRRKAMQITYLHYYKVEIFYSVIDMQLQELNEHFTESNTKLLLCVACLNPGGSFSAFERVKLLELAQFYLEEFSNSECLALKSQLKNYITEMV